MLFNIIIAYILGIIGGLFKNIFLIVPFLMFIFFIIKYKNKKNFIKKAIIIIIASIISFINIIKQEENYNNIYKDEEDLNVTVIIVSNKEEKDNFYSFNVKICDGNFKNTKLIMQVKKKDTINLEYGDKIYIKGTYKKPNEARNFGGFSYKDYLKQIGVSGFINVDNKNIKIISKNNYYFLKLINDFGQEIINRIKQSNLGENGNVLIGIILGKKDSLDEETINSFKESDLSHILAVSGMHVTYVILGLNFLINKKIFGNNKAKYIIILFLIFFIFLTGSSPSVIRACLMAIYVFISKLIYKKANVINSICISALLILIINPYSLLNIGFLLSFCGTIGIVLFTKKIDEKNIIIKKEKNKASKLMKIIEYFKQIIIVSISANIIIMPIIMYFYNKISFTFLISNILVSLVIGFIVIFGFIFIIFLFLFSPVAYILGILLKVLLDILNLIVIICSSLSFLKITIPTPSLFIIFIYYLIVFIIYKYGIKTIFLFIKKIGLKKIFIIIIVLILLISFIKIIPKDLKIYFIDVGQGDSSLIVTPSGKTILIDGGGSENKNFDVGEKVLFPYLLDRGITRIDYLIISHFDTDHVGGLFTVLEKLNVENVVISKQEEITSNYKRLLEIVNNKRIKILTVSKNDKLKIEKDIFFLFLWPNNNDDLIKDNMLNNNSIVCKFYYKDFSMLFTGDIEYLAEEKILEEYKNNLNILKSDILKIAHHGSKTSSSKEFLSVVNPKITLIGVGENNKFGHPNEDVILRLENMRF